MKNCFILGFGRSGTSLMGGILHQAGYFMGDNLYPPTSSNPKGFFECEMINLINENILEKYDYYGSNKKLYLQEKSSSPLNPGLWQRWLTYVPLSTKVDYVNNEIEEKIKMALNRGGFAYKDPRINYTINVWEKFIDNNTLFICVFREPGITIQSIVKECNDANYLSNLFIDSKLAEILWINSYLHVLRNYTSMRERFMFIHYKQLLDGSILHRLSDFLDVNLKKDFITQELNRTTNENQITERSEIIYHELCRLSHYNPI